MSDKSKKNESNEVEFKRGDVIFNEKDPSRNLYIIKEGQIQVFKKGKEGKKLPLAVVRSGEFLGEISLILNQPHSTSAIALTDVKAVQLSKDVVEAQLASAPTWVTALTKGVLSRLNAMNELIRRNGLIDENLQDAISAIEKNSEKKVA